MSAPADLSQQLEAQREIAIREIHANRSRAGSSNASDDESGNIVPSVGEMSPVSEEPSEEITDYPLFTSCFEALDLENRKGKHFRWPKWPVLKRHCVKKPTYCAIFSGFPFWRNYINILPNLIFIYSLFVNLTDVVTNLFIKTNYPTLLTEKLVKLLLTINERNRWFNLYKEKYFLFTFSNVKIVTIVKSLRDFNLKRHKLFSKGKTKFNSFDFNTNGLW